MFPIRPDYSNIANNNFSNRVVCRLGPKILFCKADLSGDSSAKEPCPTVVEPKPGSMPRR